MKSYAVPIGYIRRSVATRGDPGDVSREFQTERVRHLAGADADRLVVVDTDWGKSGGRRSAHLRAGFLALLARIEAGEVSALFAYSSDRLARDVEMSARLLNACERAGVTITTSEGCFAPKDQLARQMFLFRAQMNEAALDEMERKAASTTERQRARGAVLGRPWYGEDPKHHPGEDWRVVVAAFERAGSFLGACRALNEAKVPTRFGGPWHPRTVNEIVHRHRPDLPKHGRKGVRAVGAHLFTRLLRCPCGGSVTTMARSLTGGRSTVAYVCQSAAGRPDHGHPYTIAESKIRPWAQREVARLGIVARAKLGGKAADPERIERERARLDRWRQDVNDDYYRHDIDRDERSRQFAMIEVAQDKLERDARRSEVVGVAMGHGTARTGPIDWSADVGLINRALRDLWQYVQLGPDMRPLRAVWWPIEGEYGEDGPGIRAPRSTRWRDPEPQLPDGEPEVDED